MRISCLSATAVLLAGTVSVSLQAQTKLPDEGPMPSLTGATGWLNTKPLTTASLRGKVVLVDFWTYSCVNCLRALPYVKAWEAKYRSQGFVVIGVHAPEFDFESETANVKKALTKLGITYPVALDNDMKVWNAFHNQYWPAHYFIDAAGRIRHHHFGEGSYDESEQVIRALLTEAHGQTMPASDTTSHVSGAGVLAAPDLGNVHSPETYVGYRRQERVVADQRIARDIVRTYVAPKSLAVNAWGFGGAWGVRRDYGQTAAAGASITFRFHARDLNLVLGNAEAGRKIRFRVLVDGQAPGVDAGSDVDAKGNGVVTDHRLYQLVRQHGTVRDRTVTITMSGPGVRAYAFTFG